MPWCLSVCCHLTTCDNTGQTTSPGIWRHPASRCALLPRASPLVPVQVDLLPSPGLPLPCPSPTVLLPVHCSGPGSWAPPLPHPQGVFPLTVETDHFLLWNFFFFSAYCFHWNLKKVSRLEGILKVMNFNLQPKTSVLSLTRMSRWLLAHKASCSSFPLNGGHLRARRSAPCARFPLLSTVSMGLCP